MIKKVKLECGLELILIQDKTTHRTIADLYIKAGGFDNKFYFNNKHYNQPYGIAHFLEHYLLEHSMYGNIMNYFGKEYIGSNGFTSVHKTNYYISTVHDFKKNLFILLDVINKPLFDENIIDNTKQPIISEISKKNDNKYVELYEKVFESVFNNKVYNVNLGSIEDINKMTIQDIEIFYNAFYQPSNQVLFLTGNFDDDIVDDINDYYNNLNKEYIDFKKEEIVEPKEVVNKDISVNTQVKDSLFILSYKVDISSLTPLERNRFDYYIYYIFESNFGSKSELSNYLFQNKYTNFNIRFNYDAEFIKNYAFISLNVLTSKMDDVINLIFKTFNNLKLDEAVFKRWINNRIIDMINRYENIGSITKSYIDNMFLYDLDKSDDIEFLNSLNLGELKEIMNKLDFSNFSIVRNVVE